MKGDRSLGRFDNVLGTIGDTPLIRLNRVVEDLCTPVWIKAESFNPGGSIKDRIGLSMIEAAERDGSLLPGGTVVEGTAGNTGVGLAIAAAVKGYHCIFAIPEKMSVEKIRMLKAFGAEVVVTPAGVAPDHPEFFGNVAKRIAAETPGAVLADQFYNPVNPDTHYDTTGPEIWKQTGGKITHFVASPATGGTISGTARFLKDRSASVQAIAGDPIGSTYASYFAKGELGGSGPYKVEGAGGDRIPGTLDFDLIDEFMQVSDRDSFRMARRLTREEGLFAGGSTGLIVHVAVELARRLNDPNACIVCLLADTGERYLSKFYNDDWMRENQMLPAAPQTAAALLERKRLAGAPNLISVSPRDPVSLGLELIDTHHVSQMPVVDNGNSIGAVTEAKLMAAVIRRPEDVDEPIGSLAGAPFPVVPPDAGPTRLTHELSRDVSAVLVADANGILGVLTRYDLFKYLKNSGEGRRGG